MAPGHAQRIPPLRRLCWRVFRSAFHERFVFVCFSPARIRKPQLQDLPPHFPHMSPATDGNALKLREDEARVGEGVTSCPACESVVKTSDQWPAFTSPEIRDSAFRNRPVQPLGTSPHGATDCDVVTYEFQLDVVKPRSSPTCPLKTVELD